MVVAIQQKPQIDWKMGTCDTKRGLSLQAIHKVQKPHECHFTRRYPLA